MGCIGSTPKDSGGNRRRPGSIGEVSVYVPGLRIPKPVDFTQSLGDYLSYNYKNKKKKSQHGGWTLATLLQTLEDYLPVLLGLVKDGSHLQYKVQFVWMNQEDDKEETTMSNASTMAMLLLSVLHLMAMLLLSWANLLLLPRSSSDGHKQKVSDGKY
ncbi:hypothetical protein P8452_51369 [Trifolium repens]|nr:hypothetical protein P8452_51369 [Trifolium repens]